LLLVTELSSEHNGSHVGGSAQRRSVVVRHAERGDAPALGALLAAALEAKYRPTLGRRAADALTVVIADDLAAPAHGYWVAAQGGRVVGAAHLAVAEDAPPHGVARRLAGVIGWPRTLWALGALSILAHGPLAADEAYVGELAVAADARRQGVGVMLMDRLDRAAAERGKSRMTLWVTDDNTAARALYAQLGFSDRAARHWRVGRLVFGSDGAILMEKRVAIAAPPEPGTT
jgi:ribosomal protein S18 acetylase RimI-like enzyme